MTSLAQYLTDTKATHEEFAKVIGVSRAHLTKLVNKKAYPSRALMVEISRATAGDVPIASWFDEAAE